MSNEYKCPCCNDIEHQDMPYHEQLIMQDVEQIGAYNVMTTHYYCPTLNEMYDDEQLSKVNENSLNSVRARVEGENEENT